MNRPDAQRRWLFSVTLWEEDVIYLDAKGQPIDEDDAMPFIGTDAEAERESERRTAIYEDRNDEWVSDSTRHSGGMVKI